jgi:Fe-S-cluster containining protein
VIRLTGGDLALLVARLGLTSVRDLRTLGLVTLVCEPVGTGSVWRPRLRFRTKPVRQCPFLINDVDETGTYHGLCSLHPRHKPLVCALSPLSREVEDQGEGDVRQTWSFVPPVEGCPGVGQGSEVEIGTPPDLRDRLAEEVDWMRRLIAVAREYPGEDAMWGWLCSGEAL